MQNLGGQRRWIMGDVQVAIAQHRSYLIHAQSSGGDLDLLTDFVPLGRSRGMHPREIVWILTP